MAKAINKRVSKDELQIIKNLTNDLLRYRKNNKVKNEYFEGKIKIKNLGISVPKKYENRSIKCSWGGTAVNFINERLTLTGFYAPKELKDKINGIYNDNYLYNISKEVHLDSFIFGTSYVLLGKGNEFIGEPKVLISSESPNTCVGKRNARTRKLDSFLKVSYSQGNLFKGSLYLKDKIIYFSYKNTQNTVQPVENATVVGYDDGSYDAEFKTEIISVVEHNFGFVPAFQFVNRSRASRLSGESEITPSIISVIDEGIRTFAAAGMVREYYGRPLYAIMGLDDSEFFDEDGKPLGFSRDIDQVWKLPNSQNESGGKTDIKQFDGASPSPYIELIKSYTSQISGETGIPEHHFGHNTFNPSSGDAMKIQENRISARVNEKAVHFGSIWEQIVRMSLIIAEGKPAENANSIKASWKRTDFTSLSQDADAVTKLISTGTLPSNSEIVYSSFLGLNDIQIQIIKEELEDQRNSGLVGDLKLAAEKIKNDNSLINDLNKVNEDQDNG